jgi:hypothetical protein
VGGARWRINGTPPSAIRTQPNNGLLLNEAQCSNGESGNATDYPKLVGQVATADHLANALQRCQNPKTYDLTKNPGFVFMSRDWSGEKKAAFANAFPKVLIETNGAAARQANPNKGSSGRRD